MAFGVLDGIDGSGKGLQTRLLVERLKASGRKAESISFPRYSETEGGRLLKELLKDPAFLKVDPRLASLPYMVDRMQSKGWINLELTKGNTLISDRYASANQIHQGGKIRSRQERAEFLRWLDDMEYNVFGIHRPDLVILIDMPVETALNLLRSEGKLLDAAEQDVEYLTNSRESLLWIAENNSEYHLVHATQDGTLRTPKDISDEIWGIVQTAL